MKTKTLQWKRISVLSLLILMTLSLITLQVHAGNLVVKKHHTAAQPQPKRQPKPEHYADCYKHHRHVYTPHHRHYYAPAAHHRRYHHVHRHYGWCDDYGYYASPRGAKWIRGHCAPCGGFEPGHWLLVNRYYYTYYVDPLPDRDYYYDPQANARYDAELFWQ